MKIHPIYIYKQKKNDGIHHHSQSSKISSGDAHNSLTNFLNSTDLSLIVDVVKKLSKLPSKHLPSKS